MILAEHTIQTAIARSVGWFRNLVVPNFCFYHEMDVAVLTPSDRLWEYEIKVSQADWNRDHKKDVVPPVPDWAKDDKHWAQFYGKPTRRLDHVKRFTYVYAKGLICPEWVPEWAGLIEARIDEGDNYISLEYVRLAKDRKVEKPADRIREAMLKAIYFRYWRHGKNLPLEAA